MNQILSFEKFCELLKEKINAEYKGLKKVYSNLPSYTSFINGLMKNEITNALNESYQKDGKEIKHYKEYYRVDHSWWIAPKPEKKNGVNLYNWEFLIALEHENDIEDWTNEVAKLDFIKAPLRVVVGYTNNEERDSEIEKIKLQWDLLKNKDSIANEGEFGIILMNSKIDNKLEDNRFDVRGYLLTSDGVHPVNV